MVTPVRYKRDMLELNIVLIIPKNRENNRTGEIGLVTPTPYQIAPQDWQQVELQMNYLKMHVQLTCLMRLESLNEST